MRKRIVYLAVLGVLAGCSSSNDMSSNPSSQNVPPTSGQPTGNMQNPGGNGVNNHDAPNAMATGSTVSGASSNTNTSASGSTVSEQDRSFVHDAAIGGMSEVQASQLASRQSSNDSIRQFGQMMVTDHTKANDELKQIATGKGISVPDELDSKNQMMLDQLNKLSGSQFDQKYIPGEVSDHKDTIKLFKTEAEQGQDSDLKAFAAKTLPTLEHHLQMAEDAARNVRSDMSNNNAGNMGTNSNAPTGTNAPADLGNPGAGQPGTTRTPGQ